jgi:transcriptional regulator of acetoin/glycerol metabolism
MIERMVILSPVDCIGVNSIPAEIRHPNSLAEMSGLQETRESAERIRIATALESSGWSVAAAVRALGVGRTNLHKRMKALGVERKK